MLRTLLLAALACAGGGSPTTGRPHVHLTPEDAVRAHDALRAAGGLLVPVHWATFDLAFHGWPEPVDRLLATAGAAGMRVAVPRPGERADATAPPPALHDRWSPIA